MTFAVADATKLPLADKSVDLVFGSPPYMDARTYGIGAQRGCIDWIDWMLDVTRGKVLDVTRGKAVGDTVQSDSYFPPVLANPGSLIKGIRVGGGVMGHRLAHENEAPFPQKLAEWFIRSWCPPGGIVLDPFVGSGTTVAAAAALGRSGIGFDIRQSQVELARRRCADVQPAVLGEAG